MELRLEFLQGIGHYLVVQRADKGSPGVGREVAQYLGDVGRVKLSYPGARHLQPHAACGQELDLAPGDEALRQGALQTPGNFGGQLVQP